MKRTLGSKISLIASTAALLSGCVPPQSATPAPTSASRELVRLQGMKQFVFAYEVDPMCSLQAAKRSPDGSLGQFVDFQHTDLIGVVFDVQSTNMAGGVLSISATTQAEKGQVFEFRNKPASGRTVAEQWNCAVDTQKVKSIDSEAAHKYVRLNGEMCARISPILGTQEELTLSPYTVVGRGIFVGKSEGSGNGYRQADATVGHLVEAMGGRKRLWLTPGDLETCFAVSDRAPPPPEEASQLLAWLSSEHPDAVDPPDVSYETVTALTGITKERCSEEEFSNGKSGLVCNAPVIVVTPDERPNQFGQRGLSFVRDRSVAGLYFQEGRLVSPLLAVNRQVAVTIRGGTGQFSTLLKDALLPTIEDETKRRERAAAGRYALLTYNDRRHATHTIELTIERDIPDVEITEEPRVHEYIAGQKAVPNPAFSKAEQAVIAAAERIEAVQREGEVEMQRMKVAQAACTSGGGELAAAGAEQLASHVPFAGGLFSSATKTAAKATVKAGCEEVAATVEKKIQQRLLEAQNALQMAKTQFDSTPRETMMPNKQLYRYAAKTYRRRGVAEAKVKVFDARHRRLFEESVSVPFETTDLEIPDVPEYNLQGKKASPPSVADVEKSLSTSLVPLIESSIVRWSAETSVGQSVGDAKRGTRSWAALVASEAASERPAKLLMDILENRGVESGSVRLPVSFPEDAASKCFTIAASDSEGKANVDLVLRGNGDFPVARDRRPLIDAAFELCGRKAEKYELEIITEPGSARAVLVSLFESTPGSFKPEELARSTHGTPHLPLSSDVFVLDASGEIRAKSTGGTVVVGRLGDRDGDGVGDDADRCPYEMEAENYFLDGDGCPDETPPGFVPDPAVVKAAEEKRAAAIAAGTATKAQLELEAQKKAEAEAERRAAEEARRKAAEEQKAKEAAELKKREEEQRRKAEAAAALAAAQEKAQKEREAAAQALEEARAARQKAEEERLRAEKERKEAEEERKRAEEERKRQEEKEREEDEKKRVAGKEPEDKPKDKKKTEIFIP